MKKYTVKPPELQPIKVEAANEFHAYCQAVNVWHEDMLLYAGRMSAQATPKKKAAQAVAAAQDGTRKIDQDQDTTVPAWGQHCNSCRLCNPGCLCNTCRRDRDDRDDPACCMERWPDRCPVRDCPDYLPEEVDEA